MTDLDRTELLNFAARLIDAEDDHDEPGAAMRLSTRVRAEDVVRRALAGFVGSSRSACYAAVRDAYDAPRVAS